MKEIKISDFKVEEPIAIKDRPTKERKALISKESGVHRLGEDVIKEASLGKDLSLASSPDGGVKSTVFSSRFQARRLGSDLPVRCVCDVGVKKPDPQVLQNVLREADLTPMQAVMVGDSEPVICGTPFCCATSMLTTVDDE